MTKLDPVFEPDLSRDEDRFFMVGMSQLLRILIVCHCFGEEDSIIRIISARKDTKIDHDDGAMKQETRNRRRDAWDS